VNGALTIGTRDGATIEMAEAAGEENFFLFGPDRGPSRAESRLLQPAVSHYDNDPETRAAARPHRQQSFQPARARRVHPILDCLLGQGDHYLHLADLKSYSEAHARLGELYTDQEGWSRKAILNIAASGKFSSDRTIADYAKEIWHAKPCLVE
jgi:starch phosphorylase